MHHINFAANLRDMKVQQTNNHYAHSVTYIYEYSGYISLVVARVASPTE